MTGGAIVLFLALVAVRILFWVMRSREASGAGPDPHEARALEDGFKKEKSRAGLPKDGRQVAGEECVECGENILAEKQGTACGVCDELLHKKKCAKRHVCKDANKPDDAQPYRA